MPTSRAPSGLGRRPSAPRVGTAPKAPAPPRTAARPAAAPPGPGPQRGSSGAGRGGPRVERIRAKTPKLISARAMVLGVVVLLAFVLVYPTLHSYLAEKAAVDTLRAQVVAAQKGNGDLTAELTRWNDPAYITAQARERLSFVMPGEKAWRVVDPETVPGEAPDPVVTSPEAAAPAAPWYARVWESVEGADKASDEPTGSSSAPAALPPAPAAASSAPAAPPSAPKTP